MQVSVECFYCGHTEILNVYSTSLLNDRRCEKCKDKRKKIRKHEKKDVFGYDYKENTKEEDDDGPPYFF